MEEMQQWSSVSGFNCPDLAEKTSLSDNRHYYSKEEVKQYENGLFEWVIRDGAYPLELIIGKNEHSGSYLHPIIICFSNFYILNFEYLK